METIKRKNLTGKGEIEAWSFGREARANNESRFPNADYKLDIAIYAGYKEWSEVPTDQQARLSNIFTAGWKAEDAEYKF